MPRVVGFMFCDAVQALPNNRVSALGIVTIIEVPFNPPTAYTVSALIEIADVIADADLVTTIRVLDPNGSLISEQQYPGRMPNNKPVLLAIDLRNLVIKTLGTYTFEVLIDGELSATRTIDIVLQENIAQ